MQAAMCCSQGLSEFPDFEFEYSDTDKWAAELSGVYVVFLFSFHANAHLKLKPFGHFVLCNSAMLTKIDRLMFQKSQCIFFQHST